MTDSTLEKPDRTARPAVEENLFLPIGLSLLSDYALIRSHVEYSQAHSLLAGLPPDATQTVRLQLEEALQAIQEEMQYRCLPFLNFSSSPPHSDTQPGGAAVE